MTSRFSMLMKKHGIALLGAGLMFAGALWLVAYTDSNVVTRDQWSFLGVIEHYEKSTLTFDDIWEGHSVHRTPAYKALFLLDAAWFHLNVILESYLGVICLALSALYLYLRYSETSGRDTRRSTVQLSFLVLCAILFSFNQWALYTYSLSALDSFLGNLCFIAAWFHLDRQLDKDKASLGFEVGFSSIFILLLMCFGEGRTPAIIATTLAVMIFRNLSGNQGSPRSAWRFFAILSAACVIAVLLYFGVGKPVPGAASFIEDTLKDPLGDAKYILMAMEISVVSTYTNANFHDYLDYLIGFLVFAGYVVAFWLYWKQGMVRKARMPLFLMLYSLMYLGLILIGRYRLPPGQQAAPYPRYVTDLQLGIIGMVWVFYLWMQAAAGSRPALRPRARYAVAAMTLGLVLAQAFGAWGEIKVAPYQRMGIMRFEQFLLSDKPDKYQVDPPPNFYCPSSPLCADGTKILSDYHLAPFDREPQRPAR